MSISTFWQQHRCSHSRYLCEYIWHIVSPTCYQLQSVSTINNLILNLHCFATRQQRLEIICFFGRVSSHAPAYFHVPLCGSLWKRSLEHFNFYQPRGRKCISPTILVFWIKYSNSANKLVDSQSCISWSTEPSHSQLTYGYQVAGKEKALHNFLTFA